MSKPDKVAAQPHTPKSRSLKEKLMTVPRVMDCRPAASESGRGLPKHDKTLSATFGGSGVVRQGMECPSAAVAKR